MQETVRRHGLWLIRPRKQTIKKVALSTRYEETNALGVQPTVTVTRFRPEAKELPTFTNCRDCSQHYGEEL